MNHNEWEPIYKKIEQDFNFSIEKEKEAGEILDKLLQKKEIISIDEIKKIIINKEVFIFGGGPSLEEKIIKNKKDFEKKIKITADGATTALIKNGIKPDIIVTDLDGLVNDQINSNNKGSIVLIHSHADNIEKILKYVNFFQGKILGTTQIDPTFFKNIKNFGGFTDGDRAVFIADHFNAKNINLIGFDFDCGFGKYSFPEKKNLELKNKKLKWCKYLLEEILMKKNKNIKYL